MNERYKVLANKNRKECDLVWLHLRKERFPNMHKNKLIAAFNGFFQGY